MTAISVDRDTSYRSGDYQGIRVAATAIILLGTLVCYNASGYLVDGANTDGYIFAGVSKDNQDNTIGDDGDLNAEVWTRGQFNLSAAGLTAADVGQRVWLSDNQTVTTTETNVYVGIIAEVVSATECWVEIEPRRQESAEDLADHLDGTASKHDATEIDFELADGSKKVIQAASDTVEAAITDLDAAFGAAPSTLTTTDKTIVGAINEVAAQADLITRESTTTGAKIELPEGTDNGVNKVTIQAPAALTGDRVITVPDADVTLSDIKTTKDNLAKIVTGTVTFTAGHADETASVAGGSGKPVYAMILGAVADATLTQIVRYSWSGDNLTLYGNAAATGSVSVTYTVDKR